MYTHKKRQLKSKRLLSLKYVHSDGMREWARDAYKRKLYKEWEEHFFGTMPKEVLEVWCDDIASHATGFTTLERSEKRKRVAKQFPAWFKWEALYDSIPAEVHEAYKSEAYPPYDFESLWSGSSDIEVHNTSGGLIETINSAPPKTYTIQPFSMKMFDDIVEALDRQRKKEYQEKLAAEAKQKVDKALWDKYYKPFYLPYRP